MYKSVLYAHKENRTVVIKLTINTLYVLKKIENKAETKTNSRTMLVYVNNVFVKK